MKKFFSVALVLFLSGSVMAQTEISRDASGNKILKGFFTRQDLVTDTAFTWFAQNQQGYVPEQTGLQALKANKDSVSIIAFGGTWCGDTKYILPKFFVLADAAGLSPDRVTLI